MDKRTLAVGAATAGMVLGLPALPAAAGQDGHGRFAVETEFSDDTHAERDFCGIAGLTVDVHDVVRSRGFFTYRGKDSIPYFTGTSHVRSTYTERGTGTTVRFTLDAVDKDQRIEVDGDLLTITTQGAGGSRLAGPTGRLRNPGMLRVQFTVDSNGTLQDPDDDTDVGEPLVVEPSTGLNEQTPDFCADYRTVTGR